jgi:hypothetical protein
MLDIDKECKWLGAFGGTSGRDPSSFVGRGGIFSEFMVSLNPG